MKKIYSLNLLCYISTVTGYSPEILRDEENGLYYGVYEENQSVKDAIAKYKDYSTELSISDLRIFLNTFKNIKKNIYEKKIMYSSESA